MSGTLLFGLILFDIIEGEKYIGGPAINVALHMAFHGTEPTLVSSVGNDELGDIAKKLLIKNNVSTEFIKTDEEHETGRGIVSLDSKGNPTFKLTQPVAYDYISLTESQYEKLSQIQFDMVYFGTVVQRMDAASRSTLRELLKRVSYKYGFFDINLRKGLFTREVVEFSLCYTDILKLNEEEIQEISKLFDLGITDEQEIVNWAFQKYHIQFVLLTRGENGVTVFTPEERKDIAGIKVKVKDTVGAGDAFSAGFIMEYLKTSDLMKAAQKGNELGAYVAANCGAVPEINE